MLPIMVDVQSLPIAVIGDGFSAAQRLRILHGSGARAVKTYALNPEQDVVDLAGGNLSLGLPTRADFEAQGFRIVYLCDLPDLDTHTIQKWAQDSGALVNVHDRQALCEFHMPAILRRGNLQVTVSTDGKVAGLSRILRDYLKDYVFGPEWAGRVDELGERRADWVARRLPFSELKARVDHFVREKCWLNDVDKRG